VFLSLNLCRYNTVVTKIKFPPGYYNFPAEVREMALAHAVGDKVEAAYRRGDLFEKRRQLAEAWARYCDGEERAESKVFRLTGRAG
jgi:hypothetical protein